MANDIEKTIKKFFSFFFRDPEESRVLVNEDDNYLKISFYHPQAEYLIGKNGERLRDCEILLSKIISRAEKKRVYLDINNFKRKKEEELKEIIRKIAQRCNYKKEDASLPPMNAYQRRLVHLEISKYPDLTTESVGQEPERRVIIKSLS